MAILPDRTALTTPATGDLYVTTDVSDTTDAAGGTDKKITFGNLVAGVGSATKTFTNTTFDADGTGNSITNIENADIKAAAAIALNKLAALTASEIVISDGSGFLVSGAVATYPSLTEMTYVKGVTSAIQTQLNALNPMTTGGDIIYGGASGTPTRLANGTDGQVLTSTGTTTAPAWEAVSGGDVTVTGTPVDGQLAVWTSASDIEGDAALTFDTTTDSLVVAASGKFKFGAVTILDDTTGTTTLSNIDALDATTEATIETALDTLSNVTTVGALNAGSITSGFGAINNGASAITTTGVITGGTVEATGDTAAGDNSALGYTAAEGAILTGQGSTSDVTIKNDADETILTVPTGSNDLKFGVDGTASEFILAEKASIQLDPAGGADGDYSGITFTATAGETFAFGDVVYLKAADSEWYLAKADAVGTAGTVAIAIAVSAGSDGAACTLMTSGIIRADAGFPTLTIGAPVYISITGTTTNTVTVTAPTAADNVVQIVGYGLTANEMLVNISPDHITVTG